MKNTTEQKDSSTHTGGSGLMEFPCDRPSRESIKNRAAYWRVLWANAALAVGFPACCNTLTLAEFLTRGDSNSTACNSAACEDFFPDLFFLCQAFPFLGVPLTFVLLPDSLHLIVRAVASIVSFAVLAFVALLSFLWLVMELGRVF